jgi:hypothetical protein
MRIWSLHPKYLDTKGLLALWRETLLAKKVLEGKTKGYKEHPQLIRFKKMPQALNLIHYYLQVVWEEANKRGYSFDQTKFLPQKKIEKIPLHQKQLEYETKHLINKLKIRDNKQYLILSKTKSIKTHPLFYIVEGEIEGWEKV